MSRLVPMSDLAADDLLLDRLGAREPAGSEPVAGLLAALADQADTPLRSRAGRGRGGHRHRYLGPFAALVVAASGAGVAAAVTLPHHAPDPAEKARVVRQMDAAARSDAPSALLSRLGLPRTTGATDAQGLVMARRDDGVIVLVPAAAVAGQRGPSDAGTFAATASGAARAGAKGHAQGGGQGGAGQSTGSAGASGDRNGSGTTGTQGGNGSGQDGTGGNGTNQGGNEQGSGTSGTSAGGHTGASQPSGSAKKPATGGQGSGGKGSATATSSTSNTISGVVQQPSPLSTATATPPAVTTP